MAISESQDAFHRDWGSPPEDVEEALKDHGGRIFEWILLRPETQAVITYFPSKAIFKIFSFIHRTDNVDNVDMADWQRMQKHTTNYSTHFHRFLELCLFMLPLLKTFQPIFLMAPNRPYCISIYLDGGPCPNCAIAGRSLICMALICLAIA